MLTDRRRFLTVCSAMGFGSTLLPGALFTLAAQSETQTASGPGDTTGQPKLPAITDDMVRQAAILAGVSLTAEQRAQMISGLNNQRDGYAQIRALHMPNSLQPSFVFDPLLGRSSRANSQSSITREAASLGAVQSVEAPREIENLAFASVRELGELLRQRKITSVALTQMYLDRLKRYDSVLHCVITLTPERAMARAQEADTEITAGKYRGPLHGIPWGVKDLVAVKGYPTTWGAAGYERQNFDEDATVVRRLDEAGAVLVAKLSLGALAMNDIWFGGRTRNPWNVNQGSSGSSAGSAAATAAGLVGFAIGSETLGSISSPSTRCGDSALRPTFGFVPRTGAMALAWTMDKLGPICRAVEDCAVVMQAIYGPDGKDFSARDERFEWDAQFNWKQLRIGYLKREFEGTAAETESAMVVGLPAADVKAAAEQRRQRALAKKRREYDRKYDLASLQTLRSMGVELIPVELPKLPYDAISNLLTAEAAAAFDDLTMSGRDKLLTGQTPDDWPNLFRVARLYPAVEYIQAMRARTLVVQQVSALFEKVDVIVTPTPGEQLTVTNLSGHPAVIVPNGLRGSDAPAAATLEEDNDTDDAIGGSETPVSLTFLGAHYQDAELLAFARAYQGATGFQHAHPPQFAVK